MQTECRPRTTGGLPVPLPYPVSPLPRSFYRTDPSTLSQKLLGQRLVRILPDQTRLAGLIVETEAYLGKPDRASHAFNLRRTPRNEAMYSQPGTAYIYFTYGMHFCFNIVCGPINDPLAVLIRALEPTEGLTQMRLSRGPKTPDTNLCSGPAKLCQALQIDKSLNAIDLVSDKRLYLERAQNRLLDDELILNTPRIGIDYAGLWAKKPLRWLIKNNSHTSNPRRHPRIRP